MLALEQTTKERCLKASVMCLIHFVLFPAIYLETAGNTEPECLKVFSVSRVTRLYYFNFSNAPKPKLGKTGKSAVFWALTGFSMVMVTIFLDVVCD